jgi:hypothetical protein
MEIFRLLLFFVIIFLSAAYFRVVREAIYKFFDFFYSSISNFWKRIYRILMFKKADHHVWQELLKFHKKSGWKYGQYDQNKTVFCDFAIDDTEHIRFFYTVEHGKLVYRSVILGAFNEEFTNSILVLASHFNSLLSRGSVRVLLHQNAIECFYSRDSLAYSLFPDFIESDTAFHYNLSKDVFWAFTNMLQTGEDPVFVFSELMRMKEIDENGQGE